MAEGRRLVYSEACVRALFGHMRQELVEMGERHQAELRRLHTELERVRSALDELRAAVIARQRGELELAELRRLQAIGRARTAERDPTAPLN